jgi:hypothetical protein
MSGLESDTIGGYNSFLGAQKKVEGEAQVTSFLRPLGKVAGIEANISLFFLVEAIVLLVSKAFYGIIYDILGHKVIMYPAAVCGMIGLYILFIVNSIPLLLVAGAQGYRAIYSVSIFSIVVLVVLYAVTLGREKTVN